MGNVVDLVSAARRVLEELAEQLRPTVEAVLGPEGDRLIVASRTSSVVVEAVATVSTVVARAYYRSASTGEVYGPITDPEGAAVGVLAELLAANRSGRGGGDVG